MIFLSLRVTAAAEGGLKGPARPRRSLRGLGGVSHQQASAGIYRGIACRYYHPRLLSGEIWLLPYPFYKSSYFFQSFIVQFPHFLPEFRAQRVFIFQTLKKF